MRNALALLPLLSGCVVAADTAFSIDEPIEGVVVELSNGDVQVHGHGGTATWVELDLGGLTARHVSHEVIDGVLWLSLDCGFTCGGDVLVEPPAGVWVDVRVDNGDVEISGIDGEVVASLGAGDLEAWELASPNTCLSTAVGSITAESTVAPESLVAQVGTGNVEMRVPDGAYALDLEAGAGSVETTGVAHDRRSPFSISARVSAGSIQVTGQ